MNGRGEACAYCARTLEASDSETGLAATRDHPQPKSRGGGGRRVWCCRLCNQLKAAKSPEAWAKFMADNPRWWEQPQFVRYGYRNESKHARRKVRRAYYRAVARGDNEVLGILAEGGPSKVVLQSLKAVHRSRQPTSAELVLAELGLGE